MLQAACALQATSEVQALSNRTARMVRSHLQLAGMHASALFRLERLHRVQAHARLPGAVRASLFQLSPEASAAVVQQGGLRLHEVALANNPELLQRAVASLLQRDHGKLVAAHGYDYMPQAVSHILQAQAPPNTVTELPICLLGRLKPFLSESMLNDLRIPNAIPQDVAEHLLKASTPEDLGVTSLHTPLLALELQIGRVPIHVLNTFVSSLTSLTCLKLQNLVMIRPLPGDSNPDFLPSLSLYSPQIPGQPEPFPIHARKPFTRVIGDPIHMTPITASAAQQSPRPSLGAAKASSSRGHAAAGRRRVGSGSLDTVPASPAGTPPGQSTPGTTRSPPGSSSSTCYQLAHCSFCRIA